MTRVAEELKRSNPGREKTCHNCQAEYVVIRTPTGKEVPERCPSCYPEGDTERRARVSAPEPAAVGKYEGDILGELERAGVNVHKYQDATLSSFDPSDDPSAMVAANSWLVEWRGQRERRARFPAMDWMYLYGADSSKERIGKTGNGKTFLAIAIARQLIEEGMLNPRRLAFATAETILLEAEATFRGGEDSEKNLLRRYELLDLLIIDDVGVRSSWSPHATRLFDELTKRREAKGTIWTSNLSIPVLLQQGEGMKRIGDRIAGECGDGAKYIVEFRGPSRRKQRSMRP